MSHDDDISLAPAEPFPYTDGRSEFGHISTSSNIHVIDDAFVSDAGTGYDEAATYVGHAVGRGTLTTVAAALCLAATLILLRSGQVQIAKAAYYADAAEGNRSKIEVVPAERGIIYDRGGRALVRNVSSFNIALTPVFLPSSPQERREALAKIALLLDTTPLEIEHTLAASDPSSQDAIVIAEDVTYDQAIRAAIESASDPAVALVQGTRREYLTEDSRSLSHVLGYESKASPDDVRQGYGPLDFVGRAGIERQYENALRGTAGTRHVEVDARANRRHILAEEPATPGGNLVLTIDADLQHVAETALIDSLKRNGKTRGSVIVLQPKTGDVLALVSLPAYDNNLFSRGISADDYKILTTDKDNPLLSRTIAASLPAGSTFKPIVAAAAIDEGIVTENTSVVSTGGIRYGGWFFPDWKPGGHGITNLAKAVGESVNTYFYTIGGGYDRIKGLGEARLAEYARKFFFGSKLGIDLPGEGSGFVPTAEWKKSARGEKWYIGDTYHFAIGQGDLLVTPLQIAAETEVFAVNGKLMKPRIVRSIIAADGKREVIPAETLSEQVVSDRAVKAVRAGMRYAVTNGSARSLGDLPVAVAAKTGTAQWHPTKDTHAWFTSFAPYEDPELVVTVVIEEGGEGSHSAAPVAKSIYNWYFGKRDAAKTDTPSAGNTGH